MGADIHWVMERRHADGGWEAVISKFQIFELDLPRAHPLSQMGRRNYELFGVLSGLRCNVPGQIRPLRTKGLPRDMSPYVRNTMEDDAFFHDPGHFTLQDLRRTVQSDPFGAAPDEEHRTVAAEWLGHIEAAIREPAPDRLDQVIIPSTEEESNHARLHRLGRAQGLRPIADDTLRLVIAYDS